MHQRVLIIGLISLSLIVLPSTSQAIQAGDVCKKVGAVKKSGGKTFTCVKKGKKSVWRTQNSSAQAAAPIPTPTATATPLPTKVLPSEPKTLSDITSYDQVTYWAWKKSSDVIKGSESKVKQLKVLIGPNSGILNQNPLEATEITSKLYSNFTQPKTLTFISFSYQDIDWAQNLINTGINDEVLLNLIQAPNRGGKENAKGSCPTEDRCHSSQPFSNRVGDSIIIAGFTPSRVNNEEETKGQLQSHEFTHVIQQQQFIGSPRELEGLASLKQHIPWWLVEGGADFGGFASKYYLSYEDYLQARMRNVLRSPKRDKAWFEAFINPESNQFWIQYDSSGEIYNVGFLITEIMSAIKGPGVQMDIIKLIAGGKSMDEAFESIFGGSWKSAVTAIAELISKERARY